MMVGASRPVRLSRDADPIKHGPHPPTRHGRSLNGARAHARVRSGPRSPVAMLHEACMRMQAFGITSPPTRSTDPRRAQAVSAGDSRGVMRERLICWRWTVGSTPRSVFAADARCSVCPVERLSRTKAISATSVAITQHRPLGFREPLARPNPAAVRARCAKPAFVESRDLHSYPSGVGFLRASIVACQFAELKTPSANRVPTGHEHGTVGPGGQDLG